MNNFLLKEGRTIFLVFFLTLFISLVSAVDIGNSNPVGVNIELPAIPAINYSQIGVNSSDYWDNLNTPADIDHNLLNNLDWSVAGHTIDTDVNFGGNSINNANNGTFSNDLSVGGDANITGTITGEQLTSTDDITATDDITGRNFISTATSGNVLFNSAGNNDVNIWNIQSATSHGYRMQYTGTGAGVANTLDLYSDNQGGADKKVFSINQDAEVDFQANPITTTGTITGEQLTSTDDITMAGLLTNTMGATDTTGIYVDGATNDYTGTDTNYGYRITRDVATASSGNDLASYGLSSFMSNSHIASGSPGVVVLQNYANSNYMEITGVHTATPGSFLFEDNYANYIEQRRIGALTSTKTTISGYGTYTSVSNANSYNKIGGTLTKNLYGSYITVAEAGAETQGTINANVYGLYFGTINAQNGNAYAIYDNSGKDWILDGDNQNIILGEGQDLEILYDGTNPIFNVTNGNSTFMFRNQSLGYADIKANDYLTGTSVFDKNKGSALDYVYDADSLLTNGKVNDTKFAGYTTIQVKDYDNCWQVEDRYCIEINNQTECTEEKPKDMKGYEIVYHEECGTKLEDSVSLNKEIDVLRQAVYDLKTELCLYKAYSWC